MTDTTENALEMLHDPEALPRLDEVNRPYFAAAARGELIFQRCVNGHPFLYPRLLCPTCHSEELAWESAAGTGEVVSFAPVHRPPWNSFPRQDPYLIVLVRLDEGAQLMSSLEGVAIDEVAIGLKVRATFEQVNDELGLVRFVPA
ncbi:MAG TPA: OB-fold domain-containing protein [Pseudonocardia sp.]|jgi:uncharacterized OB-fold protein|nr:OB-fold domain-containing protein [Pseudonocardia sp.]